MRAILTMTGWGAALALVVAALGVVACAAPPNGQVRFELAIVGDRAQAAELIRERLAIVDQRDDVRLDIVHSEEAAPDRLNVTVAIRADATCGDFERAATAVRDALLEHRALALRETRSLDDKTRARLVAALPEGAAVLDQAAESVDVEVPAGADLAATVRGLGGAEGMLALERIEERPGRATTPGRARYRIWSLSAANALRPGDVATASAGRDEQLGVPLVWIRLSPAGAQRFEALTARLVGRTLAILLGDAVMSAPRVMEPIAGGRLQVTLGTEGSAHNQEAEAAALALALGSGPIAQQVTLVSEARECAPQR